MLTGLQVEVLLRVQDGGVGVTETAVAGGGLGLAAVAASMAALERRGLLTRTDMPFSGTARGARAWGLTEAAVALLQTLEPTTRNLPETT